MTTGYRRWRRHTDVGDVTPTGWGGARVASTTGQVPRFRESRSPGGGEVVELRGDRAEDVLGHRLRTDLVLEGQASRLLPVDLLVYGAENGSHVPHLERDVRAAGSLHFGVRELG